MWGLLADPWVDPTTRRALLEVVLLGLAGGPLGCWVVLAGLSYSAESLSHAMLPGLVLAALAGAPLLLGATGGLLVAATAVALAGRLPGIGRDTGVAVGVTTLFGLGVLLALARDTPAGLGSLLFGDVLAVSGADLWLAGGLVVVVLAALALAHPTLLVAGFDPGVARALGRRPLAADLALALLLAGTLLVGVQQLGNLLVVALLVGPAAAARLLTRRMPRMMAASAAFATAAGMAGLYASYHLEVAAGAAIAAALAASFPAALALRGLRTAVRRPTPAGTPHSARAA